MKYIHPYKISEDTVLFQAEYFICLNTYLEGIFKIINFI